MKREGVLSFSIYGIFRANISIRRALDEKAELQRQREAEAEAKLQARKKAPTTRLPERPSDRPSERPSYGRSVERSEDGEQKSTATPGPPRLALAGNKPSWREREEAKRAQTAGSSQAEPSSTSESVPKWRPGMRQESIRRDSSPADSLASQPLGRRQGSTGPAVQGSKSTNIEEPSHPETSKPTADKFVPPHKRNRG